MDKKGGPQLLPFGSSDLWFFGSLIFPASDWKPET
jgi:hypothetical protein